MIDDRLTIGLIVLFIVLAIGKYGDSKWHDQQMAEEMARLHRVVAPNEASAASSATP